MPDEDLMIGQVIGNYKITQKLGQGAMGVVYLADHSALKRQVAIKFLAGQFCSDPVYVDRFMQEARAAAQLHHPNIIGVYDAGSMNDEVFYLVMEYVRGRDLAALLDEGEVFEEKRALRFVQMVASALVSAHEHGIVHRDIKPENLILTPEGEIKLGDLGLATWTGEPNDPGQNRQVMGTAFYMSPEQICNPRFVDARTDIYSLGTTLYHLVTGIPPYLAATVEEVVEMQTKSQLKTPRSLRPELSEDICQLITKMMAKDVTERYQSMNEVLAALDLLEKRRTQPGMPSVTDQHAVALQRTLTKLRRGLDGKGDFPSIIGPMNVVSKLSQSGNNVSIDELTEIILSDFALTNKLLKLVNSAFYSTGGEKIATISRAVLVLGLAQVRSAALSLMLFQNMESGRKQPMKEIKDASVNNFFSGILARNIAQRVGGINKEEAFICAVFFNLGKLIATYYLLDEKKKVDERVSRDSVHEQIASQSILGLSYEELGIKMAGEWNFPEQIVATMRRPSAPSLPVPANLLERLRDIAFFSNDLCALLRNVQISPEEMEASFQELMQRFENCFSISFEDLGEVIQKSLEDVSSFAKSLGLDVDVSSFAQVAGEEEEAPQKAPEA